MSEAPSRPSPEALLRAAAAEGRGRLRLFLGAAPGVGKTYEMLMSARAARAEGVDIVAAVVETHGRVETAALLDGIELIPRHTIEHRGHALAEMDLDAVLARRPKVALVDELAHSNAPGSRHPKRWQDVMELLGAGIDVWSTLNIQHVESLNDIVARITRIRVRETVPDGVITRADAIEVVDLTPEDLIKRLREGRIYLPKVAERALAHYFSPGNLTALRELALRLTAQRVDEQLLDHMQAHAIAGPWAAGERVLVCVTPGGAGPGLVRYGRRLAERLRAAFVALYIETPRAAAEGRDRVEQTLRLAESLGAETVTRPGRDVAAEILAYAREVNATNIVIGTAGIRRLWPFRRRVVERLIADARDIPVHVIGRERAERPERQARTRQAPPPRGWLIAAGAVVLATVLGQGLQVVGGNSSVTMGFLTAILAVATTAGLWPSVAAVIASVLSYNFFFLPPLYTFTIADPRNVVALFFFGIAALVASQLASRLREQTLAARSRARTTEELYGFSRKVAAIASLDDLLWASAYQVASMLRLSVVVLLPEGEGLAVRAGYPPEDVLEEADLAAATLCFRNNKPAGRGADTLPGARRLFIPLATAPGPVGVLGLDAGLDTTPDTPGERSLLGPGQRRLLDALADQIAVAIERIRLAEDVVQAQRHAETERLRSALLTSLSHDLRTPLAAILGAATGLETYGATLPPAERDSLLRTIREEAERLSQFVANLLDMTRLAAGAVTARREPVDLDEAVGSALRRAGRTLDAHRVATDLPAGLPMVDLDPVLFEQVLVNLLDNASKYTPEGSTITLAARAAGDSVELTVEDEGPGIPTDIMPRIFEKFVRAEGADRRRAGTGLGLAICRGFLTAMGATITAANRNDPGHGEHGGAVFTLTLPVHAEGAGA